MSFKATLRVEDKELRGLFCEYTISQTTEHKAQPTGRPNGGKINIRVESTGDRFIFDWATSETQAKSGSIIFYRRDGMSKMKELTFTDAFCTRQTERFTAEGHHPMEIDLELSAREIGLGGSSKHGNTWSK